MKKLEVGTKYPVLLNYLYPIQIIKDKYSNMTNTDCLRKVTEWRLEEILVNRHK